jgi:hypothetical protein
MAQAICHDLVNYMLYVKIVRVPLCETQSSGRFFNCADILAKQE